MPRSSGRLRKGKTAEQQKEREGAEALSRELATARREIEANTTLLTKAREDATQIKQTAEAATAEQQKARESAEALSRELATARREIEANAAQLIKAREDAAKFRQTADGSDGGAAESARKRRGSVPRDS